MQRSVLAVMATFPARSAAVRAAAERLAPQVDRLVVVFNEHTKVPDWCASIPNLEGVLPDVDRKDVAKFYVPFPPDAWVFLVDDDLVYPLDYVESSIRSAVATGLSDHAIFGYHGTTYGWNGGKSFLHHLLNFARTPVFHRAVFSHVLRFDRALAKAWRVEQLGTGTVLALGKNLMDLTTAEGSERRVDTRLASWAFQTGRPMVALPRARGWMQNTNQSDSIFASYTLRRPQEFLDEVALFSGKIKGLGPLS